MTCSFTIRALEPADRAWVGQFIAERWGAEKVIAHRTIYYPRELPGFIAFENNDRLGLATYQINGNACEIVTLDSLKPNCGIGTALIDAVEHIARESHCARLWLVTTNDNLRALRFYQRRGFVLASLHRDAVDESRKFKPEIPLLGMDGIPIRDEIELEIAL